MIEFGFDLTNDADRKPVLGLIVLQADETIEGDFRRLFLPQEVELLVSRVASGLEVTTDTLSQMEHDLPRAASLFPAASRFDAVAYACTSGASVIGSQKVASLVRQEVQTEAVTDPVSALIARCEFEGISRLGLLSPYVEAVSEALRNVLKQAGIETPVFGSFNEAEEAKVVRIDGASIASAAIEIGTSDEVDAVFLSCTNLRTLDVLPEIAAATGKPVFSSNSVLAWHLKTLIGDR